MLFLFLPFAFCCAFFSSVFFVAVLCFRVLCGQMRDGLGLCITVAKGRGKGKTLLGHGPMSKEKRTRKESELLKRRSRLQGQNCSLCDRLQQQRKAATARQGGRQKGCKVVRKDVVSFLLSCLLLWTSDKEFRFRFAEFQDFEKRKREEEERRGKMYFRLGGRLASTTATDDSGGELG